MGSTSFAKVTGEDCSDAMAATANPARTRDIITLPPSQQTGISIWASKLSYGRLYIQSPSRNTPSVGGEFANLATILHIFGFATIRKCAISSIALLDGVARQMFHIEVVFVANEFHQLRIREQMHFFRDCPRLGIGFGVIDRNLNIHVSKVFPPETFDDMQGIRGWFAWLVQPGLSIETPGVDHQSVAVPLTD